MDWKKLFGSENNDLFSKFSWYFSAALGVLVISMGLYAFEAFGNTFSFVSLWCLGFGCGLMAVFVVLLCFSRCHMSNGKGDKPRPKKVDAKAYEANWKRAFGKPAKTIR